MPPARKTASVDQDIERRIAERLAELRADRGWSLDDLAERAGISRATLSRIERSELSPTAAMLGALCSTYGWTLSRLMADAEARPPQLVRAAEQAEWTDPDSHYRRRMVSPPSPDLRGELVEVHMPAGATVSIEGAMTIDVDSATFDLRAHDCLRYALTGPSRFRNTGKRTARYLVAMVRP